MKEIRRENLRKLLASPRFNGDREKFCQDAGITKGRLSQLLDDNQPFGDAAERNLIEKLNLEDGFLSRRHYKMDVAQPVIQLKDNRPAIPFSPLAELLARLFDKIPESDDLGRSLAFNAASVEIHQVLAKHLAGSDSGKESL